MRILFIVAALFILSGCETLELRSVTFGTSYSTYQDHHSRYLLGYYSNSYYNDYRVYGNYGHRYYYAPRQYRHHRYYSAPPVMMRHYRPPVVVQTPPRRQAPPRHVPPQVRNDQDGNRGRQLNRIHQDDDRRNKRRKDRNQPRRDRH